MTSRPTDDAPSVLALVGMMGSGKSTVGALLASRTGRAFVDLDVEVETRSGRPVTELFAQEGEAGFRALELATLQDVLATSEPTVLATGGGVVTTAAARQVLSARATTVWIDVPADDLVGRVGDGEGRPLLAGEPLAALRRLDTERRGLYEQVADVVVDGRDAPADVADRVLAALEVVA